MEDITIAEQDKICAPGKEFKDGSCIDVYLLELMAKALNEDMKRKGNSNYKKIPIDSSRLKSDPVNYKKQLLRDMSIRMKKIYNCNDQRCWIEQNFVTLILNFVDGKMKEKEEKLRELTNYTMRPLGAECDDWLSTSHIQDYFAQIVSVDPNFYFFGALPRDFEELSVFDTDISKIKSLEKKGKHKIGMIFNLDKHNQSGSHWVALYIDLKEGLIYFVDSYGSKPHKEFMNYMNMIKSYMKSKGLKVDMRISTFKHQKSNSECGMYSIYFIEFFRNGKKFDKIPAIVPDYVVYQLRDVFFYRRKRNCPKLQKILRKGNTN